jgi:GntR family histidine utilization transcriptional repressor
VSAQSKPRYQQLKESIIARISNGELQPSDRVPSENELVGATGVSRMTANRALRELNHEGYVERIAGVGTFVADLKATSHALEVRNIADEIHLRGHEHSSVVLKCETRLASQDVSELLHIKLNSAINHVLIVHRENEMPIQIEDRFVNKDFAPEFLGQDFSLVTPSAYLSSIAPLQEAEHVVRAALPGDDIRGQLQMANNEACLVVTRRTWAHGQPVSFARLHHPGSRFELTGHYVPPGTRESNHQHADIVELRNIDQ